MLVTQKSLTHKILLRILHYEKGNNWGLAV